MTSLHIQGNVTFPFQGIDAGYITEESDNILSILEVEKDSVSVIVCTDDEIHSINRDYRKRDYPTDVISFAYNEEPFPGEEEDRHRGDIFLSLDRARAQSLEYDVTLENEISRLLVHSILHLYGYDHEQSQDKAELMYAKEDEILHKLLHKS